MIQKNASATISQLPFPEHKRWGETPAGLSDANSLGDGEDDVDVETTTQNDTSSGESNCEAGNRAKNQAIPKIGDLF